MAVMSRAAGQVTEGYLADNSKLAHGTHGLRFRLSKRLDDDGLKGEQDSIVLWGTVVYGIDENDGWLRVGDRYLPMTVSGTPVLVKASLVFESFLIDNSKLKAKSDGLGYRWSKNLKDVCGSGPGCLAIWSTIVSGEDEGDGWVRVGARYLPMSVNNMPVLIRNVDPTAIDTSGMDLAKLLANASPAWKATLVLARFGAASRDAKKQRSLEASETNPQASGARAKWQASVAKIRALEAPLDDQTLTENLPVETGALERESSLDEQTLIENLPVEEVALERELCKLQAEEAETANRADMWQSAAEQALAEKIAAEKVAAKTAAAEKAAAFKASSEKAAAERAAADHIAADQALAKMAAAAKEAADQAVARMKNIEQAAIRKVDSAAADKAVADWTIATALRDKLREEKEVAEKTAADMALAAKDASERASAEQAVAQQAAVDNAAAQKKLAEKIISVEAACERAAAEKSAFERIRSKRAVAEKVVCDRRAAESLLEKASLDEAAGDIVDELMSCQSSARERSFNDRMTEEGNAAETVVAANAVIANVVSEKAPAEKAVEPIEGDDILGIWHYKLEGDQSRNYRIKKVGSRLYYEDLSNESELTRTGFDGWLLAKVKPVNSPRASTSGAGHNLRLKYIDGKIISHLSKSVSGIDEDQWFEAVIATKQQATVDGCRGVPVSAAEHRIAQLQQRVAARQAEVSSKLAASLHMEAVKAPPRVDEKSIEDAEAAAEVATEAASNAWAAAEKVAAEKAARDRATAREKEVAGDFPAERGIAEKPAGEKRALPMDEAVAGSVALARLAARRAADQKAAIEREAAKRVALGRAAVENLAAERSRLLAARLEKSRAKEERLTSMLIASDEAQPNSIPPANVHGEKAVDHHMESLAEHPGVNMAHRHFSHDARPARIDSCDSAVLCGYSCSSKSIQQSIQQI